MEITRLLIDEKFLLHESKTNQRGIQNVIKKEI